MDVVEKWRVIVGARLRRAREDANLTQVEEAALLHVGQNTVSAWERGVAAPRDELRPRIAAVVGRSVTELFAYDDENGEAA